MEQPGVPNGFLRCSHCKRKLPVRVRRDAARHLARTVTNLATIAHIVALDVKCPDCGTLVDVRVADLIPVG